MGGTHWEPENAFGSDARRRHSPGHPAAPRASDTCRLMPQCEAISYSFPGTFHMVPLLHSVLAYSQGLCCPLEGSHLPMQRSCCIYSPLSYTALDRKNHQRVVQRGLRPSSQKHTAQPPSPSRGKLGGCQPLPWRSLTVASGQSPRGTGWDLSSIRQPVSAHWVRLQHWESGDACQVTTAGGGMDEP